MEKHSNINGKRSLGQGVPRADEGVGGKTRAAPAAGPPRTQLPSKLFRVLKIFWVGIFGLGLAFGLTARADDVTVTFTDDEQRALFAIFDAAVKARGMQDGVAGNVTYLWEKMRVSAEAQAKAKKAAPPPKKK